MLAIAQDLEHLLELVEQHNVNKSISEYGAAHRSLARGLWSGVLTKFQFVEALIRLVEREFPRAWAQGAKSCGVLPSEYTDAEKAQLEAEIDNERKFAIGYADFIIENKKGVGKLSKIFIRTRYWIEGFKRVVNKAKLMACGDKKLKWKLNPAEHCSSCMKLAGKVKRASFWLASGVQPKSHTKLQCRQKCQCELEETTDSITPGPLPSLP